MKNRWKIAIAVLVVCILAILPCFYFMSRKESYEVKAEAYQIVGGEEVVFPQNAVLELDDTYGAVIKGTKKPVSQAPIFFAQEERLVLTQCYAAVFPFDSGKMYKINAFSEIFRKNGSYYLKEGNKEILLEGCFLFNGSDTYLFLEEITVTYGNKAVNIGPFSVVAAHYGQQSSIYQYRSKNNLEIPADAGALVASLGQGYFVQMDTDSLISEAGQQLLYTRPENLKNLK